MTTASSGSDETCRTSSSPLSHGRHTSDSRRFVVRRIEIGGGILIGGVGRRRNWFHMNIIVFTASILLVQILQLQVLPLQLLPVPVSSFTIRPTTTVQSIKSCPSSNSILGVGLDRDNYMKSFFTTSTAAAAATASRTSLCLILKRNKDNENEPFFLSINTNARSRSRPTRSTRSSSSSSTSTSTSTSTSLDASRLRNSHNDYLYSDGDSDSDSGDSSRNNYNSNGNTDQMTRRQQRRSRQRREEEEDKEETRINNNEVEAETTGARRKARRKRQEMYEYENENGYEDRNGRPSGEQMYDGSVESVMRRRKYRQRQNNSYNTDNDNDNDNDILSNTVDLGFQAINGVKYVAKRTASTSKTLLNDLGSEINKRFIDDDYYDGGDYDRNGVQEADWYYVSRDNEENNTNKKANGNDRKGGWVRKNKRRRYKSSSPLSPSSSYSQSREKYHYSQQDSRKRRRERPKYEAGVPPQREKEGQQQKQQRPAPSNDPKVSITNESSQQKRPLLLPPTLESNAYFPPLNDGQSLTNDNHNGDGSYESKENDDRSTAGQTLENEPRNKKEVDNNNDIRKKEDERVKNSSPRQRTRRGRRRNSTSSNENKKVYSVYPQDNGEILGDMEELYGKVAANAIDSVGNMVVDVVEGKYWDTTSSDSSSSSTNRSSSSRSSSKIKSDPDINRDYSSSPRRRHWRDRLTEKVDYALGVHENGNYYKKWEDKISEERMSETGNDPVSIFYGRLKREHGPKRHVNFWEEDGSLMSLFFGRTPSGSKLSFDRASNANICTTAFKVSFQYTIAVLSQLCRWISCRGSLPQPIVVFFLAASALSAPKRRRMLTVGITIIALRTLAEALHGYVHDGWEEDDIRGKPSHDLDGNQNDPSRQAESNN